MILTLFTLFSSLLSVAEWPRVLGMRCCAVKRKVRGSIPGPDETGLLCSRCLT